MIEARPPTSASDADILVLLVEDDPTLLELTTLFLEQEGMTVISARDGRRALRVLRAARPDVVVTDLMMPVMDGFAFLERYRRDGGAVPVVAVSAFEPYLDQARALGAQAVLHKPYEPLALARTIEDLARRAPGTAAPALGGAGAADGAEPEAARLRAIVDLELDRVAPEPELHRFVERVAAQFEMPIALISVITGERQFWTAGFGIPPELSEARGSPRVEALCTHAVVAHAALIVHDVEASPSFRRCPLTPRGLRFYAGVPLVSRQGHVLGTLCVLDRRPRAFSHFDLELLGLFGRAVMAAVEARERRAGGDVEPVSAFPALGYVDRELEVFGSAAFHDLAAAVTARSLERGEPLACVVVAVPRARLQAVATALAAHDLRGLVGRLGLARLGWLLPGASAEAALAAAERVAGAGAVVRAAAFGRSPAAAGGDLDRLERALGEAGLR